MRMKKFRTVQTRTLLDQRSSEGDITGVPVATNDAVGQETDLP